MDIINEFSCFSVDIIQQYLRTKSGYVWSGKTTKVIRIPTPLRNYVTIGRPMSISVSTRKVIAVMWSGMYFNFYSGLQHFYFGQSNNSSTTITFFYYYLVQLPCARERERERARRLPLNVKMLKLGIFELPEIAANGRESPWRRFFCCTLISRALSMLCGRNSINLLLSYVM